MPIELQQYGPQQVQQSAQPAVRVNQSAPIEAFGGGKSFDAVNEASRGVANSAENIIDIEKKKADQVATMNANMQLTKLKNDAIYNPQSGLMTMKGKDAFAAPEKVMSSFNDQAQQIGESLSNDQQKYIFQHMLMNHKAELDGDIQKHVSVEAQKYDSDTTDAAIGTAKDDAALNFHDAGKVQQSIETQKAIITDFGQRNGWSPQMIQQKAEDLVSKTHMSVVDRMLANDQDMAAKQYYEANKDQVSGHDATILDKAVEEGSIRGESQRQSDALMNKGIPMSTALDQAREIEDPKLRDATVERVRQRYSEADAAKRDSIEKYMTKAGNQIDQKPDINEVAKDPMWQTLSTGEKTALKNYARAKAAGDMPDKNSDAYYNLMTMAGTPELKADFLKENLMLYKDKIDESQLQQLIQKQADGRAGKSLKLDGYMSDKQIVDSILGDNGYDPHAKPGTDKAKNVNLFRAKVDQQVEDMQQKLGKKVTNEQIRQIADNLMIQGRTDNGLFGSGFFAGKKHLFQVDGDTKQFKIEANNIPVGERKKIAEALGKHGIEVTDKAVLELYKRKIGGMTDGN